ncbi:hypothetical protein C4D60_Mb03t22600 [Musa balbisiana]|uniref:Uncharacterized protein n=1 Tax=Musa balbisiana TaxID=52838 RepID=A0A4S8JBS5_MUSBA|nr:hypothetical protein C4D60_Mb03t22600 [Musa balbisiana]
MGLLAFDRPSTCCAEHEQTHKTRTYMSIASNILFQSLFVTERRSKLPQSDERAYSVLAVDSQ